MNETTLKPNQVISTLNDLIEINRDAQKGFQQAAEKIADHNTKTFCLEQSRSRTHFVGELQTLVHTLGDEPDNSGSVSGALRRGWMDLKAALGGGDHAIMVVVEASEDHAVAAYKKALAKSLPADVRDIIQHQNVMVKQSHDQTKALRDSLKH